VLAFISKLFPFFLAGQTRVRRSFPAKSWRLITGCALVGVIIGGRLGYVSSTNRKCCVSRYRFARREGGMSSHGGMFGCWPSRVYYAPQAQNLVDELGRQSGRKCADWLFFGRCANFINGELYGRITNVPGRCNFQRNCSIIPRKPERAVAAWRANRSGTHNAGRNCQCGEQPPASSSRVAPNSVTAPSVAAL